MENNKLNLIGRFKSSLQNDRDFTYLIFVAIFSGIASGVYSTIFNNFLSHTYNISETQRGFLELPREMPGALILLVLSLLAFMGDVRIAMAGMVLAALGAFGLGFSNGSYYLMIATLIIYSLGTHMCMPLTPSIGMSLSSREKYGHRLGLYSAWGLGATLVGYAIVWSGFYFLHMSYPSAFMISAMFYVFAALFFLFMKNHKPETRKSQSEHYLKALFASVCLYIFTAPAFNKKHDPEAYKSRIIYNLKALYHKKPFYKKYSLFYMLSMANGARKQIFLTFAPWVLITYYGLDPVHFAILGVIVSVVSIGTRTIVGKAIDTYGERLVLSCEAVCLFVICFGYIFSGWIFSHNVALIAMCTCYVIDCSMTVVEMARSTYVKKISAGPDEVTPTLSTGVSLDHIVSMTVPFLGGLLWAKTNAYQSVFIAAAAIALINFALATRIRIKPADDTRIINPPIMESNM